MAMHIYAKSGNLKNLEISRCISGTVQPKSDWNVTGDRYEQEADYIASQVMSGSENKIKSSCVCEGDCPNCKQGRPIDDSRRQADHYETTSPRSNAHQAGASAGQPLPSNTRSFMESRFGYNFSHVRVHSDTGAFESAAKMNAQAYTIGSDIVFGKGEYAPSTDSGKQLLAHELTHVVQQSSASQIRNTGHEGGSLPIQRTAKKVQRKTAADKEAEKEHRKTQMRVVFLLGGDSVWDRAAGRSSERDVAYASSKIRDTSRIWLNTIEWIKSGYATLSVLEPTPNNPTEFFDPTVLYPNFGGSVTNTIGYGEKTRGHTDGRHINLIVRPGDSNEDLGKTLMHEVQHIADAHQGETDKEKQLRLESMEKKSPESMHAYLGEMQWNKYQSEFRSYWIESYQQMFTGFEGPIYDGRFGGPSDPGGELKIKDSSGSTTNPGCLPEASVQMAYEKQLNIARHIITSDGMMRKAFLCSPLFRERVTNLKSPSGINMINSVRIDSLQRVISNNNYKTIWGNTNKSVIVSLVKRLNELDKMYLRDRNLAKPFWDEAKKQLSNDAYQWMYNYIVLDQKVEPQTESFD